MDDADDFARRAEQEAARALRASMAHDRQAKGVHGLPDRALPDEILSPR